MRRNACSMLSGGLPLLHDRATNASSDSRNVARADDRPPSKPNRRLIKSQRPVDLEDCWPSLRLAEPAVTLEQGGSLP